MNPLSDQAAHEILEVVPVIMRTIRAEMRSHRGPELSVPQFRALNYIDKHPGAPLRNVAEHIGLTPPSTSKLVDGMVERGLLTREECTADRRRINLHLTHQGTANLEESRRHTQECLAQMLADLSEAELQRTIDTLDVLKPIFTPPTAQAPALPKSTSQPSDAAHLH